MPSCSGSVPQDFLSQRVMSEGGMVQGFWSASVARARKRCIWNRESASAISFETPGTWLVRTTKLCFIQRSTTRLTKSIMRGFLECPEFIIDTTDKLSHQNWRRFPARRRCYMAQATTMGKSSYHSKLIPCCWFNCMCRGQRPWNHFPWKYPPKPIEPAASVYSSRFWAGVGVDLRKKERPFHLDRKSFHRARSLKNSLLSLMWWKRLGTPLVKLIARCRKVLPGTTTLHANWRVPISDCNSTRRTDRRFLKESSSWLILMSLSWGKRASMRTLSKIIPMNSISQEGPIVLEATTGA